MTEYQSIVLAPQLILLQMSTRDNGRKASSCQFLPAQAAISPKTFSFPCLSHSCPKALKYGFDKYVNPVTKALDSSAR